MIIPNKNYSMGEEICGYTFVDYSDNDYDYCFQGCVVKKDDVLYRAGFLSTFTEGLDEFEVYGTAEIVNGFYVSEGMTLSIVRNNLM